MKAFMDLGRMILELAILLMIIRLIDIRDLPYLLGDIRDLLPENHFIDIEEVPYLLRVSEEIHRAVIILDILNRCQEELEKLIIQEVHIDLIYLIVLNHSIELKIIQVILQVTMVFIQVLINTYDI